VKINSSLRIKRLGCVMVSRKYNKFLKKEGYIDRILGWV
jgi:hypothetical protein